MNKSAKLPRKKGRFFSLHLSRILKPSRERVDSLGTSSVPVSSGPHGSLGQPVGQDTFLHRWCVCVCLFLTQRAVPPNLSSTSERNVRHIGQKNLKGSTEDSSYVHSCQSLLFKHEVAIQALFPSPHDPGAGLGPGTVTLVSRVHHLTLSRGHFSQQSLMAYRALHFG